MLSHILYAKEEVEKGTPILDICKEIEERKKHSFVCFIPENLTALKNGGRISPAAAAIGNTIGLKPVILLQDGELVKDSVTRSPKKKFKEHLEKCVEKFPISEYDYSLLDFDGDEFTISVIKENLIELIGEIFIEGLFELATNKKVPKLIRYPLLTLFILLYLALVGLLILLGIRIYFDNKLASFVLFGLAIGLLIITIVSIRKKMKE